MHLGTGSHSQQMSQGEAGAQPRSIKNKSNGTWAKMVTRGANPVTLEKRQKKSLFLCNIMVPTPSLPIRCSLQPSDAGFSLRPSELGAVPLVSSLGAFFFLSFSSFSYTSILKQIFGLLPFLAFDF